MRSFLKRSRFAIAVAVIAAASAVGVFLLLGFAGIFDLSFVLTYLPGGVGPVELSLEFTTFTFVLGFVGALGLGLVRAYPPKRLPRPSRRRPLASDRPRRSRAWIWKYPLYGFASGYVAAVRGTPFLVQLQVVFYVVIFSTPQLLFLGWNASYWAGFIALFINTMGYQAEAIRGGFQSVDAGQIEAAKAMGLNRLQVFARVTFPQGIRLITLPLANEWISNFKTATILSLIGIQEVFYWAHIDIALFHAMVVEAFVMLSVYYLVINVILSRVVTYLERVRRIPGLGVPIPQVGMPQRLLGFRRKGSAP